MRGSTTSAVAYRDKEGRGVGHAKTDTRRRDVGCAQQSVERALGSVPARPLRPAARDPTTAATRTTPAPTATTTTSRAGAGAGTGAATRTTNDKNDEEAAIRGRYPKPTVTLPPGRCSRRRAAPDRDDGRTSACSSQLFLVASLIITPAVDEVVAQADRRQGQHAEEGIDADTTKSNDLNKAASTAKSNSSKIAKAKGATSPDAKTRRRRPPRRRTPRRTTRTTR